MIGYLSAQCSSLIPCLSFSFPLSSCLHHPPLKLSPSYGNWETFHEVGNEIPSPHTDNESSKEFFPAFFMTFHNKQIHWHFYGRITVTPMTYHSGGAAKSDTQFSCLLACLHCCPVSWDEQGLKYNPKRPSFCAKQYEILKHWHYFMTIMTLQVHMPHSFLSQNEITEQVGLTRVT